MDIDDLPLSHVRAYHEKFREAEKNAAARLRGAKDYNSKRAAEDDLATAQDMRRKAEHRLMRGE